MLTSDLRYEKLLAPVDFSETGRKAFFHAVEFSKHFEAPLTILHVREGADGERLEAGQGSAEPNELERGLLERLDELEEEQRLTSAQRARITLVVRGGTPWLEIVRFALVDETDLIIMGTHGHTGFKHIFMGSQCERVVQRAPCEVLAVKPEGYAPDIDLD